MIFVSVFCSLPSMCLAKELKDAIQASYYMINRTPPNSETL